MNRKKIQGYTMAVLGFVLICINALSYITGGDYGKPALTTIGIILVFIGLKLARDVK